MDIELSEDTKLRLVMKGEHTSKPIGLCNWGSGIAAESGIHISFGHRGDRGVFLSKKTLNKLLYAIRKKEKEIKENGTNNDDS